AAQRGPASGDGGLEVAVPDVVRQVRHQLDGQSELVGVHHRRADLDVAVQSHQDVGVLVGHVDVEAAVGGGHLDALVGGHPAQRVVVIVRQVPGQATRAGEDVHLVTVAEEDRAVTQVAAQAEV